MIGIHIVHRRLAEIHEKSVKLGGYHRLTDLEQRDLEHCMIVNAKLVQRMDELKDLSFVAHQAGDVKWQHEICAKIDELEAKML